METLINVGASAAVTGLVQLLIWAAIQRSIERRDRQIEQLSSDLQSLRDERVAGIERQQKIEGDKRERICQRLETIELDWVQRKDCIRQHEDYTASVLKLQETATKTEQLLKWVADLNNEQVSIGKDLAAITARVEDLKAK